VTFYPYILIFIKPTAYALTAVALNRPFWEIFLPFAFAALLVNYLIYRFPDLIYKIRQKISKRKKENGLKEATRKVVHRWSQKYRFIPFLLFLIGPVIPLPGFEEICLIIGRVAGIPFYLFLIGSLFQFFLIYFLGHKLF